MNSNFPLRTFGRITYEDGRLNVRLCLDFCDYYRWFIHRHIWLKTQPCKYDPHVTVWIKKIHGSLKNAEKLKKFVGKKVEIQYSPLILEGGSRRGFKNFYLKCYSKIFSEIEKDFEIKNANDFLGYHVTLCNIGKSGARIEQFQSEFITLKCKHHQ